MSRICHGLSLIFKMCADPENGGGDTGDGGGNEAQDPYSRAELRLYQNIVKARTNDEFRAAIDDAVPVNHDKNQQLMYSLEKDCF